MGEFNLDNLQLGTVLPQFKVIITKQIYRKYNFLIREINPIHTNKKYAQNLGYKDVLVAGNFLYSYVPKWIIGWIGKGKNINRIKIKFGKPVYLEEELVFDGKIVSIENKNGEKFVEYEFIVNKSSGDFVMNGSVVLQFKD